MCKFLSELFKPKEDTGYTMAHTSSTEVETTETIESGATTEQDTQITESDENNNQIEEKMDRVEVENKINEYVEKLKTSNVRKLVEIAVHCSATKEGVEVTIEDIDKWHKARGFKKQKVSGHYCGYHYVIALDGTIMCGRDLSEVGAHVSDHNSKSIGVCYVGGLDSNGKAKDTRTPEQKETLIWLISKLKKAFGINKVQGHRDYSPDTNGNGVIDPFERIKACPCFDAIPEYKNV